MTTTFRPYLSIGDTVTVLAGRHRGKIGIVTRVPDSYCEEDCTIWVALDEYPNQELLFSLDALEIKEPADFFKEILKG